METMTSAQLAQLLYVAYYGRPADSAGQQFWADQIDAVGTAGVAADFGASAEFTARFGELSNEELVQNLYQQLFSRDGEQAGVDYWVELLENGTTLADIALEIANGAQNEDVTALSNKVAVAQSFTELAGEEYTGDEAANSAREFLLTIDENTDVEAVDVQAAIDALTPTTVFTLAEALAAEELPEGYEIDAEAVFAADVTVEAAVTAYTAAQEIVAGAANAEGLVFADLFTWNIVDDADAIIAEAGNVAVTGAGTVTVTNESISQTQFDALSQLENFELGEVEVVPTLNEGLAALEVAREAQTEAADALEEKFDALADANVGNFPTATFSTDELEDYELDLESAVLTAQQSLNTARTSNTDAELNANLAAAQKIIDEDTGRYNDSGVDLYQDSNDALVRIYASTDDLTASSFTWSTTADTTNSKFVGYALVDPSAASANDQTDATTYISALADGAYTAKQVQNFVTSTLSAYEAHVTQNGETAALVAELKDAVALYLAQNADVPALSGTLTTAITAYENDIKTTSDEGRTENIAFYDAVDTVYSAIYTGGDNNDESTLANNARAASVESLLETLEKRNELSDAYGDAAEGAVAAFATVDNALAAGFNTAQAAVDVREGEIEAVTTAQTNAEEFAALVEAYNTASDSVTAADEALGYSIEDIDEAVEFGTEENDLFILDLESLDTSNITEVSILDAAAGDIIFFGSDYALGSDIEAGDNNALEVFITAEGANTVVNIETEAFGSNTADNIEVTILGVASDSVSFEGGVLTIA